MSSPIVGSDVRETALEACRDVVWRQWGDLGASTGGTRSGEGASIIDPEALVLASCALISAERRLHDLLFWWADVGAPLLSVQRTKTLSDAFPQTVAPMLGRVAARAVKSGDARWRSLANADADDEPGRSRKGPDEPRLQSPSALLLRLRAGFGVSAKADVFACLLGSTSPLATRSVADAVGYSRVAVRSALKGLRQAGFVRGTSGRPARYYAPQQSWADVLGRANADATLPGWKRWTEGFAFLLHIAEWGAEEAEASSPYLRSSSARDLVERFRPAFEAQALDFPDPDRYRGAEYLDGFAETVQCVAAWLGDGG